MEAATGKYEISGIHQEQQQKGGVGDDVGDGSAQEDSTSLKGIPGETTETLRLGIGGHDLERCDGSTVEYDDEIGSGSARDDSFGISDDSFHPEGDDTGDGQALPSEILRQKGLLLERLFNWGEHIRSSNLLLGNHVFI